MQSSEKFCELCGTPMKMGNETPAKDATDAAEKSAAGSSGKARKKGAGKIVILLLAVLFLIAAGVFVYFHFFTYRSVKIEDYDGDADPF